VTGLTTTVPGQGLGAQQESSVPVLEPVLNYRIYLPDEVNAVEMMEKLKQLEEEDPQLHILWNEQLQEIHAQMMGQVQIEVLTQLIKNGLVLWLFLDRATLYIRRRSQSRWRVWDIL